MRFKRFINIHTILLVIVVVTIAMVIFRFFTWGVKVDLNDYQYTDEYSDSMDVILPALDKKGHLIKDKDDTTTIVCFGNAPFADDRNSKDNLANMIAAKTGATVYNCSVSGSYLAMQEDLIDTEKTPMDIFCFYWLVQAIGGDVMDQHWDAALKTLGADAPKELSEVRKTLSTLNFKKVDVVVIMYDATDYLEGHSMYSDDNHTDVKQFTGNLEAGIELLRHRYPRIRVIVMSPTYAYAIDESGDYVSSDMYTYGQDVLSTYAIKEGASCMEQGVTFIDHIYGTITEDNASEYLSDHLHLNVKGRELVADRFIHALQYFDEKDPD